MFCIDSIWSSCMGRADVRSNLRAELEGGEEDEKHRRVERPSSANALHWRRGSRGEGGARATPPTQCITRATDDALGGGLSRDLSLRRESATTGRRAPARFDHACTRSMLALMRVRASHPAVHSSMRGESRWAASCSGGVDPSALTRRSSVRVDSSLLLAHSHDACVYVRST
jgi:hypothetical protein